MNNERKFSHKDLPDIWIQSAIDKKKAMMDGKLDSIGVQLIMFSAFVDAHIAGAIAQVRIAEALEKIADKKVT